MPVIKEKKEIPATSKKPPKQVTGKRPGVRGPGKIALKIYSNEMPAGVRKPIPVPSGKVIISISNPNNGQGEITFDLNGLTHHLPYNPGVVDLGTVFDFPSPANTYFFTNTPIGPNPVSVFLNIEEFI